MKKVVSLALSTLLVLSLAACGKADSSAAASSESKSSASSSSASSNSTSNSTQDYSPDGIKVGETYTTEDGKTYERVWNGTGSDLPTPSPEPKITYDNDFQAQTLVDNEECTIILQSVGYDDDYGYYWKLYFKNKTSDKKLGYSFGDCTLNGVGASLWLTSVEPGQEETEIHHWEGSGLKIYNINPQDINTVSFYLNVYNELDDAVPRHDLVDDDFVVYPKGEENATEPKHETQPTDLVLVDNDACALMICGFDPDGLLGYTAKAYIENKTDKEIMFAFRSGGSINGFECFPETDTMGIDAHTNVYMDIYYRDYLDTYEANGKDPTSITEMVMPIVINNFNTRDIYVDETFTINPQTNSVTTSK